MKIPKSLKPLARRIQELLGRDLYISPEIFPEVDFHGNEYGGFALLRNSLTKKSNVVSCGIGEDISFDLSVIEMYQCNIYGFDPMPRAAEWIARTSITPLFHFYPFAIAGHRNELELFYPADPRNVSASLVKGKHTSSQSIRVPCLDIEGVQQLVGIDQIDVLKLDIEGAEYEIISSGLTKCQNLPSQIAVEFHHFFGEIGLDATRKAFHHLNSLGYVCCWVSDSHHEVLFVQRKMVMS